MSNQFKKSYLKILFALLIVLLIALFVILALKNRNTENDEQVQAENTPAYTTAIEETATKVEEEILYEDEDPFRDYKYDFDLSLDVKKMTMDGVLNFTYYNNNEEEMDHLIFYLYANSYEKEEYYAIKEEHAKYGYPFGFSAGSIEIKNVESETGAKYEVAGSQNHLLVIDLEKAVEPDESIEIKIEYTVNIPHSFGRFGYGEDTISLVNCNPIMAVYDKENGYYMYEYNNIGDPFFTECGDYTARITVPKDYIVAPTGKITNTEYEGKMAIYNVDGQNRRDFGFVASDEFEVLSKNINGVEVYAYGIGNSKFNEIALEAAADSIEVFSELFGEYPYETFNVVETNFFIGGMEYPGMVLIGDAFYSEGLKGVMEMIVAHETAHQWWYAMVGNDQIAEPWLDEALATFSQRVYYEHVYPESYEKLIKKYVDDDFANREKRAEKRTTRIDLDTTEYINDYSLIVYGYGGWMIDDLREYLGEEDFYKAMSLYMESNKFQIAHREDLEEAIEQITGEDITWWFDENMQIQVGN
ncbi:MAG: M1 family metallopeptidase [Eubacteriales bacterium]